jgi:uncharacterized protein YebE (UPF0316 family)
MDLISTLPVWMVGIAIFAFRVLDVSLGTLRTIAVVQARVALSVVIGFLEVLIWITAVSQVVLRIHESPLLLLAYAGGFAAGNACGIVLERTLAIGTCVIRMISSNGGQAIADTLRSHGYALTTFEGRGRDGRRTLLFIACPRHDLTKVVNTAAEIDPHLFYTVERFSQAAHFDPLPHHTGWRAVFKKK